MANFQKLVGPPPPMQQQQPNIRPPIAVGQIEPDADDPQSPSGPPTSSDAHQAFVHHVNSVEYNAKHAAAHQQETEKHAGAMMKLLKKMPGFAKHAQRM